MGVPLTRGELMKHARLGSYEILRLIGHGATASVFEGRHVALGKPVAIKVLHEHLAADPQIAARFLREGRIAAQLRHPNVLDVLDVGEESGVAYLVMELLEGRDLKAELARGHGPLPLSDTIAYVLPIASALAHAHSLGVVHRDLKPANIFLAHDVRGGVTPKLVDFGLSKLEGLAETKPVTESEIVAGTVAYMAPEQTFGVGNAGPAADQFALALIVYECVTGNVPFAASTFYDLIEQIRAAIVLPPSECVAGLSDAFDDVVLRALARDPAQRWPDIRAFAAALLPFADPETANAWRGELVGVASPRALPRPRIVARHDIETLVPDTTRDPRAPDAHYDDARASDDTPPPLPVPPGESPFHVKGMPYRGLTYLVARALPRGIARLEEEIDDPRLRTFVRQPFLASGRYDVLPMRPLTAALARALGRPLVELVRTTAAAQARYDARTVFQRLLGPATIDDLPSRVQRFGAQYYDFGEIRAAHEAHGTLLMTHTAVPEYLYPWYAPMQAVYAEEVARILGAKSVSSEILEPVPAGMHGAFRLVDSRCRVHYA